jgi:glycosyltransferase involved in cell wall biosynthesis
MDVAVFHDLPRSGGAAVVLAQYLRRLPHRFTLYSHASGSGPDLVRFDAPPDQIVHRPLAGGGGVAGQYRRMLGLNRAGRRLAREIDAAAHDVVLCFPSVLSQAPAILPHLQTPSLYYAPEPLRAEYDDSPTVRSRLSPYTRTRRRLDREATRAATRVVTLSYFIARRLRQIYDVEAAVVYPGVDASLITPLEGRGDGSVLSVGALHPRKGHELVIEALARLPKPRPRLIVIADRGDAGPALRAAARTAGVELELLEGIPFERVIEHYQRASVVACAAQDEPFGLTALEAMAAGTPVVAVDSGGYRETVEHERTGLRVQREPAVYAAALGRVLRDEDLAAALSAQGRRSVEEHWSWDTSAAEINRRLEQTARG